MNITKMNELFSYLNNNRNKILDIIGKGVIYKEIIEDSSVRLKVE